VGPNYVDYQVEDATQCAANTDTFDFITVDSQAKEIRIRPGRWRMDRDMIVPPGFTVVCGAGTELDMTDSAFLLSRSPLLIEGTSDAPVVLDSSDGTGRGLVVLQSGRGSSLSHVRFTNLASAGGGHWAVTGAVTFYEAPVVLNSCVFHGNHSEDALNLIRSDFKMQSCEFSAIAFDAFDSDFSRGSITQCAFRDCGNDAIDVSGSAVEIVGAKIARCGDKGLSVGEASQVTASDVCVDGARMGLVSKDRSELLGREILLTNCRYGLAAYQKKPEFGPGTLRLTGLQFGGPKPEDLIERGSTAEVDGSSLAADKDRLADILYPSAKGAPVAR